ncbi:MAG: hypothetical protein JO323_23050 [Acidobacteriia bacterium]|nr:hypothetical protein [Terriglobia bacterium]
MNRKATNEIVHAAIDGFMAQKARIDQKIMELKAMLNGGAGDGITQRQPPTKKRQISSRARRRMALAERARWAKMRRETETPVPPAVQAKPKRRISKEGMRRIIAGNKKGGR